MAIKGDFTVAVEAGLLGVAKSDVLLAEVRLHGRQAIEHARCTHAHIA